ncbi:MAG TPA: hypothetical protein VK151_16475 [Fluviicola sp.]|nr:hypothetical protein [Fluviicola sp.]
MGRQAGVLRLTGNVGEISFYHHRVYGYLVRRKGGATAEQVKRDPQFERTRENASEFGAAAKAGKLLRDALKRYLRTSGDAYVTQRLAQCMVRIAKLDVLHERGERRVSGGLQTNEGRDLLQRFPFFASHLLDDSLIQFSQIDPATGTMILTNPVEHLLPYAKKHVTHARLKAVTLFIDFDLREVNGFVSQAADLSLAAFSGDVTLVPEQFEQHAGFRITVLLVVFLQELNGELYEMEEGKMMGVVAV